MTNEFKHLLSRGKIKNLDLRNRIVMSPMGTFSENRNGSPSSDQIEYYRARARGGVGMVIVEAQYVTNKTDPWIGYIATADTEEQRKGWDQIIQAIHAEGAKACLQLGCGLGRNAFPFSDEQMVSASEVPSFYFPDKICRGFTIEEIKEIIKAFGRAALRAKNAEADAIEIHAHSGYIIDQFMTPIWNKRVDEYGGSFENRMRFVKEIYEAMRLAVGPDYPILMRMASDHDFEGGRTLDESIEIVNYMKNLGVDAFDIDRGCYERKRWICPSVYTGLSCMIDGAVAIKKACNVTVLCSGTNTPETGEIALAQGKVDFIMMGRSLIADPDLPNKLIEGRRSDIRPCLFCNQICVGRLYQDRAISCAINAQAVHELQYPIIKTKKAKKVVIVGGGPGGLEAARVAAEAGHIVTLFEKTSNLGGQLIAASRPKFKRRLREFIEWEVRQLEKLKVSIIYNKEIKPNSNELKTADKIILALGARPLKPRIKGIDNANVIEVTKAHLQPNKVKGNNIVIAGGGLSGCDCALELAMEGRNVTIVEMQDALCPLELIDNRNPLLFKLDDYHVKQLTSTKIIEFTNNGVCVENSDGVKTINADTIIYAFGAESNNEIITDICKKYPTTSVVGDCLEVSQVAQAVRGGFFAGWQIH